MIDKSIYSDNLISWYLHINYGLLKPLKWQEPLFKVLVYALMGKCSKILISSPPQHGKTLLICESFISYYMVNHPHDKVIVTAYSQDRATKYGLRIRNIINNFTENTRFKPQLSQDQQSKTNFMFSPPFTGELLAAGAHGAIMGNPANLIVIDDPIKELKDANSPTMQDNLEEWYVGSINTRLRKNNHGRPAIVIVVAQRLSTRDMQGILKENNPYIDGKEAIARLERGETIPEDTFIDLNFPALCENPNTDLLNREKGEPLWEEHKNREDLLRDKRLMGSHRFNTIMQGNPTLEKDYVFKHEWFYNNETYDNEALTCLQPYSPDLEIYPKYRFWDLAGTSKSPSKSSDYYCGVLMSKNKEVDTVFIHHMERSKKQALQVLNTLKETIVRDGQGVSTIIEQEPGSQSVIFLNDLQRQFHNYNISYNKPTESKLYRSYELKRLAENNCLKFVVRENDDLNWVHTIIRELETFDGEESDGTRGKHDDIVDALSSGANYFLTQRELLSGIIKM